MKFTKIVALALVAVLVVLAVSCEQNDPTKLKLNCNKCGKTHVINIAGCTTWRDAWDNHSENNLESNSGKIWYNEAAGCKGQIYEVREAGSYASVSTNETIDPTKSYVIGLPV